MLIGIDGNEANVAHKVGISEYAFELLIQFNKLETRNSKLQIYLKDRPNKDFPKEDIYWQYNVFGPQKLWTQIALPIRLYAEKNKPAVFFTPSHYAPRFSPIPTVISLMDLSYLYFPHLFAEKDLYQLRNWTEYSVIKASRIITISNSTKNDILKEYNVPAERVVVIYPGIKHALSGKASPMDVLQKKYGISDRYILSVGTLQPRKNTARLIEAFGRIKNQDSRLAEDLQLVVVGKKGWLYEEIIAAPEKYGVANQVKFLDFVSDEDLAGLYQHAICYAFPSLYEGFGLPVLEAMKHDCPVITSNVSSLPEAAGDAALFVDPKSTEDIAKKLKLLIEDSTLRQTLIKKGREQVKKFSWEKAARETLSVLEQVGSGR